jgi:hypothetical protein
MRLEGLAGGLMAAFLELLQNTGITACGRDQRYSVTGAPPLRRLNQLFAVY